MTRYAAKGSAAHGFRGIEASCLMFQCTRRAMPGCMKEKESQIMASWANRHGCPEIVRWLFGSSTRHLFILDRFKSVFQNFFQFSFCFPARSRLVLTSFSEQGCVDNEGVYRSAHGVGGECDVGNGNWWAARTR